MSNASMKVCGTALCVLFAVSGKAGADEMPVSMREHKIGYVTTDLHWALYQTQNVNADCPEGLNGNGPRETFKALYPNGGSVETTQLARESLKIFPGDKGPQFPYILAKGATAIGLNLDGKQDTGFTGPTGEKGIDNNLFKVIGCNAQYRSPDGQMQLFANKLIRYFNFDRIMIELSKADNLTNANDVDVTVYRGRDPLLLDATGENVAPGGSQRVDLHYGRKLIQHLRGRIINGVLTTEPIDAQWPWANYFDAPSVLHIRDMRLSLNVTGTGANGLIAGYTDVDSFYHWVTSWSTHHLSYGRLDPSEFYWAVKNNADAYPDKDGKMTAISSAITINMAQVFIQHPEAGQNDRQITADTSHAAR
jgi:hypothetical protein